MTFIEKLRAEFSTLKTEYEGLLKESETRDYTAEEKTAQEARFAKMADIQKKLDERTKFAQLAIDAGNVITPKAPEGEAEFAASQKDVNIVVGETKIDKVEFNKAANSWLLTGQMDRKFATITTATQSSILLPTSVATPESNTTGNVFREAHAITGRSPIVTSDTGKMNIPILDGSAGGVVAETASSATENAPTLGDSVVLTPETYQSGTAWLSGLSLGANGFDLLSYIQSELDFIKELGLENAIADALIADAGITQGVNCVSGVPTYKNMVTLNRCLPRRFDRLKVMILDGSVIAGLEGLTGDDGHPILTLDPQNNNLLRFNGTPVLRCDRFADYAGTEAAVMGVVISMLGFKLRDAGQKQILRYQESAKPNQTGINLCSYHAFGWTDAAVGKLLA